VDRIGFAAFKGCSSLASISLPSSVEKIESFAFAGCGALSSIGLPEGLAEIESDAFSGCASLSLVSLPSTLTRLGDLFSDCESLQRIDVDPANPAYTSIDGVLYNKPQTSLVRFPPGKSGAVSVPEGVDEIAREAFSGCRGLTSLDLPDSLTTIGFAAFKGCAGLVSLSIPAGVIHVGTGAFSGCSALAALSIPAGVDFLDAWMFDGCRALSDIDVDPANAAYQSRDGAVLDKSGTRLVRCPPGKTGAFAIPPGVEFVGDYAFSGCAGLTSVSIPSTVAGIGSGSFAGCTGLGSLSLPSGVRAISSFAFWGCSGLVSVSLPDSLTSIGSQAFKLCSGLSSIVLPASLEVLPESPFWDCAGLVDIEVDPANPKFSSVGGVLFNKDRSILLRYPEAKAGSYQIPEGVVQIGPSAFGACSALESVSIPTGVVRIGGGAFARSSLSSVEIGESVVVIGYWCFGECEHLSVVSIPKSVAYLNASAFKSCSGLTAVFFSGDAPGTSTLHWNNEMFSGCAPRFAVLYLEGRAGWATPKWRGWPAYPVGEDDYPFAFWLENHGIAYDTALDQDLNGDGVDLLVAYALGLDPRENLAGAMPAPVLGDDGTLGIVFRGDSPGILYVVETSTDLVHWTDDGVSLSEPDAEGLRRALVVRDVPRRFLRLTVRRE
jgi:hypothetical protein